MNAVENSKKKYQTFTISNTGDDNIIDMIGLGNDTQNLEVECKLAPKSKTNVSIPDLKTNDNNKVLPINTEAAKTLSNEEFLSTTIHKRKHGPKSKTKVPLNAENEETPEKIMRLNECKVINNKESNTINLLYSKSVKKLKLPKKYNHNLKTSNLEYPPPYPITPPFNNKPSWKNVPPIPKMTIEVLENKVIITCNMNLTSQMAKIKMYELFVCQETDAPPNISMWKKMANLKACKLPMICELEKFDLGYIYDFALRAVDIHNRRGPFAVRKTKI
ncbi:activating transcription factor 7-interacting protein 2-like [Acyrthosiphon pisum]|uniref:Activating transcription factor 7-interacting protein Fn3 domain-containing protein n=1 Tax=Acyrthosiphon pisum TaxID=7029 RepID=A0A8R2NLH4_ACYPI|nr:activating transcription factor 7-interacting protein 2-like [Acyrthosiphon pisum]